ncbi:hypothetical protein B0H10DRAFT_1954617 [Mycena sp. CBHHK59/15]|nr:hypothetical protein B0H10DRAFT_1954617 [Mycena sp. CBHHK59/15]
MSGLPAVEPEDGKVIRKCRKKCGGPDGEGRHVAFSTRSLHRRQDAEINTDTSGFANFLASAPGKTLWAQSARSHWSLEKMAKDSSFIPTIKDKICRASAGIALPVCVSAG